MSLSTAAGKLIHLVSEMEQQQQISPDQKQTLMSSIVSGDKRLEQIILMVPEDDYQAEKTKLYL